MQSAKYDHAVCADGILGLFDGITDFVELMLGPDGARFAVLRDLALQPFRMVFRRHEIGRASCRERV